MTDTRYVETEALIFAMEKCEFSAKDKLRQMTKHERIRLQVAMALLDDWIEEVQKEPAGNGTLTVKKISER